MTEIPTPTLVVVSGPPRTGKTSLAHTIARAIPCPAVCRDEIKEGMVHAAGETFRAATGDPLTQRTLPVFFDVLGTLLAAGVTTVAEAAFQDPLWRHGLEPLLGHPRLRIVHRGDRRARAAALISADDDSRSAAMGRSHCQLRGRRIPCVRVVRSGAAPLNREGRWTGTRSR